MEGLEETVIGRVGRDFDWKGWKGHRLEGLEETLIGRVGRDGDRKGRTLLGRDGDRKGWKRR